MGLDNHRVGLGCGFVCNLFISQKRDAISCSVAKLNQVRFRWRTGDGGRRVYTKGLDGGRDRTAGFLNLIKKSFLFGKTISYFKYRNNVFYIKFSRKTPRIIFDI